MMEQVLDVPQQEVITKDNVSVKVDAIVFIQVMDAAAAAYRVDNLHYAITQLCMTNLRTVVGIDGPGRGAVPARQDQHAPAERHRPGDQPWGVKVNRIEIKDLTPPPDITNAMARQMKAERERRAVITEADGEKQAAITVAEGPEAVGHPAGRGPPRGRLPRRRGPRARSRGRGQGDRPGVRTPSPRGDVNAINYFVAQKYVEAFAKLAESPQQKTVIVPAEMSALVGTIGRHRRTGEVDLGRRAARRVRRRARRSGAVPPTGS